MVNWSDFSVLDFLKTSLPVKLGDRFDHIGKMNFDGDTNVPDGFMRLNRSARQLEEKSGINWLPATPPLFLSADRSTASDTPVAITDFDNIYPVKASKFYRYSAFISYSASDSGFVLRFSNLVSSGGDSLARFTNIGGTDVVVPGSGSFPQWVCPASAVATGGRLYLQGYIKAGSDITLQAQFRRESASGTLVLRAGSWLQLERMD
ncbi:hypothetical protein TDB9533_01223 [Thalassocella blandensis]|nr:hypothetical protein TDB9533_01223 [Thalassocella blandensis]